ncbi:MAG: hydroxyisourate hydrolase [Chloroflexota bacterium]
MATISSHVLDSVIGDHGKQIGIQCFHLVDEATRELVFDVIANDEGRIVEQVEAGEGGGKYELVFKTAVYFQNQPDLPEARQIMDEVVVRFTIPNPDERIHIPLVLSPHSYTIWWSA